MSIHTKGQCDGCRRADKYGKPEWHADCRKGRRINTSSIDAATGDTHWSGWVIADCTCHHHGEETR